MCGRFTYLFTWKEIHDRLQEFIDAIDDLGDGVVEHPPRHNITPTQPIVVIHQDNGQYSARLMRWGLVPTWVKDPSKFSLIINARVETILEKPSFRGGLRHHRCIIPASGYYEWRRNAEGQKQPFYITHKDGSPMSFAGVYSSWMGPSGEEVDTTAIITVPSNPDLSEVHDRMPALIPAEMTKDWLDVRGVGEKHAHEMLRPAPADVVAFRPVSTRVNSNRSEGAELIKEISLDETTPAAPLKKVSSQGELF